MKPSTSFPDATQKAMESLGRAAVNTALQASLIGEIERTEAHLADLRSQLRDVEVEEGRLMDAVTEDLMVVQRAKEHWGHDEHWLDWMGKPFPEGRDD